MARHAFDHLLPEFTGTSVQAFLEDCAACIEDRQAALRRDVAATVHSQLAGTAPSLAFVATRRLHGPPFGMLRFAPYTPLRMQMLRLAADI